jgi:signal transduction histidine kinase
MERAYNGSSFHFPVLPERASIVTTSSTGTGSGQQAASGVSLSERTAHLCAEAALFMRDHVLSLVSHDLRGPLNAIHSWAYVLERKLDANDPAAQVVRYQ